MNPVKVKRDCVKELTDLPNIGKAMAGPKWKPKDYTDLLSVLFVLTKTMKTKGVVAIEAHIENPKESRIFQEYPKIMKDHFALDLICDTLRMMTMNLEDPHQVEEAIEKQIEKHHHEAHEPAHALQNMADALPALGIVAAVLGIIKTMGAINQPPEYLGKLIGSALVGTFLGVFLAYGFVGLGKFMMIFFLMFQTYGLLIGPNPYLVLFSIAAFVTFFQ